jgi:NADH:ubiquinone oxidoreductase subunit E
MLKTLEKTPSPDALFQPDQKKIMDEVLEANRGRPGATMVVLNELQGKIGFVSEPMQVYVAKKLRVAVSAVHGVVSFYSFFTTAPRGRHTIKFCLGTACYVGGAEQLIDKAKQIVGIDPGETTQDGQITLEICRCVGACSQAPVIVVDDDTFGRVRPNKFPQIIKGIQEKDTQEITA